MTFVVQSWSIFLGAMFACGYRGAKVSAFFDKLADFLAFVKLASSLQRRLSLRTWENGMAFFTCFGRGDECSK